MKITDLTSTELRRMLRATEQLVGKNSIEIRIITDELLKRERERGTEIDQPKGAANE